MGYEALARKWRPQQFADVVGQEHVTQTLRNAIRSGRLHHAYLFVGPRGIGKTSIARIFAKALCCMEGGPTETPCDRCDSCLEITGGRNLDVIEIDGASNTGVDHVRDLRDQAKFVPVRGPFKIYIIDEVHMLSTGAFNALLKTLEEPPPHVKFMFATTEPEKVLPTIISRCQRFDLRRIPVPQIVERLKLIADTDGITVEPEALLAVARGAEGGLRDAESAFDQLIAFRGDTIREEDVLAVFGLVSRERMESLATHILNGDLKEVLAAVAALDADGKDLSRLVIDLITHFRNLLICLNVDDAGNALDATPEQIRSLEEQATLTNTGRLLRVVSVLSETEDRMKYALSRKVVLETALIRCARAATVVTLEEILEKLNALRSGDDQAVPARPEARQGGASGFVARRPAEKPDPASTDGADDLARLRSQWPSVIERMRRVAVGSAPALQDARPMSVSATEVRIGYPAEFAEEMENILRVPRSRTALRQMISRVMGREVQLRFDEMGTDGTAPAALVVAEPLPDKTAPVTAPPEPSSRTRRKSDWYDHADVRKVLEAFNGDIADIR